MNKQLVLANGELCVALNQHSLVERLFFPHVGAELHTAGSTHRLGIWIDGKISWLDSGDWQIRSKYLSEALVGHTVATNQEIGILLEFEDFVDADKNSFIRNIHLVNMHPEQRCVRLFLHQAFNISDRRQPRDTAQYMSEEEAILHYSGRRAFMVGGKNDIGQPFNQYSVGLFGDGLDGTWRDAEDGELSGHSSECGQVDSTIGFSLTIGGLSSRRVYYWLSAGISIKTVTVVHRLVKKSGAIDRLNRTSAWWRKWLASGFKLAKKLEPKYRQVFLENLMLVRAHTDRRGAIISGVQGDTIPYCRPREAGYMIWPLARLGLTEDVMRFFTFCRHAVSVSGGFLLTQYHPDGAVGESKRPYQGAMPPLQSDVTALVLFVFAQAYSLNRQNQKKMLDEYYYSLVVPMANFLTGFVGSNALPKPSYDFKDSETSVYTYTTAITYASLLAAADLSDVKEDSDNSVKWRACAEDMRASAQNLLRDDQRLFKSINGDEADVATVFGAFMFGLFDFDSDLMRNTFESLDLDKVDKEYPPAKLWVSQYLAEINQIKRAQEIFDSFIDGNLNNSAWVSAEIVSTLLDTLTRK